jgi:beta-phosphoglucomutase-like phosphatase (HAD superfamily)
VGVKDGCSVDGGKNKQLEHFCVEAFGEAGWRTHTREVVLFDDDARNVEAAEAGGFNAVHTPNGLTRDSTRAMYDALRARGGAE